MILRTNSLKAYIHSATNMFPDTNTSQQPVATSVRSNMHLKGLTFPYHLSKFHSFWLTYNEDITVHVKQDFGRGRNGTKSSD